MIRKGDRLPRGLHRGDRKQHALFRGDRAVYASPEAAKLAMREWLRTQATIESHVVEDTTGRWFEVAVELPAAFAGNGADGWTGVIHEDYGPVTVGLSWSADLTNWMALLAGWSAAPGAWPESISSGTRKRWRARFEVPLAWKNALVDLRMTTTRAGKTVTAVNFLGTALSLPNAPYAMPADAAQLQTDLRAAGVTGAVVTTSAGSWSAVIRNYGSDASASLAFNATWSGDDITQLRRSDNNAVVSLPNYPYTMPADESALEADLVAAGWTYAQVTLHKDLWEVFAPDVSTTGLERRFEFTVSPTDPIQMWTFFGTPNGTNPQSPLTSAVENVRIGGSPEAEAFERGFARLGFVR